MDKLSPSQRSKVMARVRGKDTKPETRVRSMAHAFGLRFRLHQRQLKGTPDLVFPRYRIALFVHGCFWHQHVNCKRASVPTSREEFWQTKLARNVERDTEAAAELRAEGWRVEVIWECETKVADQLRRRIETIFFRQSKRKKTARAA